MWVPTDTYQLKLKTTGEQLASLGFCSGTLNLTGGIKCFNSSKAATAPSCSRRA